VNFANKVRARQGQPPLQPLYTIDDAEQAIRRLSPVPYHQTFQVGPATGVFYDAGHILGSAVTVLAVEGRTIVFSGDLGRTAPAIPLAAATSVTCVRWRSPRNSTPGMIHLLWSRRQACANPVASCIIYATMSAIRSPRSSSSRSKLPRRWAGGW